MKIYDIISVNHLRKVLNDPLTRQYNPLSEPINITSDNEWEVEDILDYKLVPGR